MSTLSAVKRPSLCMIKLVEAVGVLLGVPPSQDKSKYKAPMPSNYDATVNLLDENYGAYLSEVARMRSERLGNKVANELFAKTLEPGFDYEQAVNDGGLAWRDLFNAIQLVMMSLVADHARIPIIKTNVLVAINGTMASYAALDTATHIFKHGVVTAIALTVEEAHDKRLAEMMKSHLSQDLLRRMKLQYKMADHCFGIESAYLKSVREIQATLLESIAMNQANIIVYGLEEDRKFGEGGDYGVPRWLATSEEVQIPVLLTKKNSRTRPFPQVFIPRTWMVYMDSISPETVSVTFLNSLLYVRPGDSIIVLALVESDQPKGDGRIERFEMGSRAGLWVDGLEEKEGEPRQLGWNTAANDSLRLQIEGMLINAQIDGTCMIIPILNGRTKGQRLADLVTEHQVDLVVLRKRAHIETIVQTVQAAPCSVLLLQ